MNDIDPVEFGKLIEGVKSLTLQVDRLTVEMKALQETITGGKGIVLGLLLAAGGIGAACSELIKRLFH